MGANRTGYVHYVVDYKWSENISIRFRTGEGGTFAGDDFRKKGMALNSSRKIKGLIPFVLPLLCLLLWALAFQIPMSTDDWHTANILKQGRELPLFSDPYFFRLPVCKIAYNLIFPLFLIHPFWAKITVWGSAVFGIYLVLSWFFRKHALNSAFLPITALLVFFAPNQYELVYNWSSLPFCLGFLFSGLGFYFMRKEKKIPGSILYLLSFFTLESFLVLGILLEAAVFLPVPFEEGKRRALGRNFLFLIVPFAAVRLFLQALHPYSYGIGFALNLGQARGLVIQCGFVNFFKVNWVLSLLQLLLYGMIARAILGKKTSDEKKRGLYSILLLTAILFAASAYYYAMNYSAGRALAGQVAFCWGLYMLLVNRYIGEKQKWLSGKIPLFVLAVSVQLAAVFLIYQKKQFNFGQIRREVAAVRDELGQTTGLLDLKEMEIRHRFKRDWIFASGEDIKLMFRYYLTDAENSRLRFGE